MLKSFARDRRGNVAVTFGLAVIPLVGLVGAAVDYGRLSLRRTELNSISDSAALSAAKLLSTTTAQTPATREALAVQAGNSHAAGQAPAAQPTTTVFLSENAVRVSLSESMTLAFGGLLGRDTSTVMAQSKATYAPPPPCIATLNTAAIPGITAQGSARIEAAGCAVWSNATNSSSSITVTNSASIRGNKVCAVGGGSGSVTPTLERFCEPALNPFAGAQLSAAVGCTFTNEVITSSRNLFPGVYCGGLVIRANVTLSPGLYTIRGGPLQVQGSPTVSGTGVSFLLGSGAFLDFQGNPTINVSAMTTGALAGLVMASDPSAPAQTSTIQGSVATFLQTQTSGSIYLPNHALNIGGNAELALTGPTDRLVVGSLAVAGSSRLTSSATFSASATVRLSE